MFALSFIKNNYGKIRENNTRQWLESDYSS